MMQRVVAGACLAIVLLAGAGWASAATPVVDTMCNEKAQGMHLQMPYPQGWTVGSTGRSMLATFSRQQGDLVEMLTLQVSKVAVDYAQKLFAVPGALAPDMRYERWRGIVETSQPGSSVLSVADRQVADGRPAVLVEVMISPEKGGFMTFMQTQMLQVYESGRIVMLSCSVTGKPDQQVAVGALLKRHSESVCEPYFASLRFMDEKGINDTADCDGNVAAGGVLDSWERMGNVCGTGLRHGWR